MSVVGIDIGNFKSSIGIARQGGIDIVANEYSDRITPTYVAYTNNERFQGHSAKQQEITNHQNTISCFKRLIARKINDPQVLNEKNFQPLRITQSTTGDEKLLFNVDYLNELKTFTCEQVLATFITKLKTIAESNLNAKVTDCVISCPVYMTDAERRAILDSAQIAGLNCLKLMNETTAIALSYGLYNNNLPEVTEKPHTVVFVDMGYTHLQVSVVNFNKGKLRVLATTYDNNLGGRDFDKVIMDYFHQDFQKRYKLDCYSNQRPKLRLRAECDKLKKLMSSIASTLPLNIECFMNDVDVSGKMQRTDFEKLSEDLFARVRKTLESLLVEANLKQEDIDLVEIVGGCTRIPYIKQMIKEVFGKEPSTTLNADEACARGCTLMCAILSPTFKVKEFKIEDCQLFPITLNWKGAETDDNELEVFPRFEKIPLSKLLTIYKREPFEIEARYRFPNNIPYSDARIGKFYIGNVVPNAQGDNSEVKLKARITKNGIFEISSPQIIETFEVEQKQAEDQKQDAASSHGENGSLSTNGDSENQNGSEDVVMSEDQNNTAEPAVAAANVPLKKKKTKAIDLPLTAKVPQFTKMEINNFMEQEFFMIQQDRKEKERSESKNNVEEYIYETREKLSSDYQHFILEENKSIFMKLLDDTESWLYSDEAENQEKSVYVDRLTKLKNLGEPLKKRYRESADRPFAFEEFGRSLQLIKKAINLFLQGDEKYNHLDKVDVERIAKLVDEKQKWFEEKSYLLNKMKLTEDPVVLVSHIKEEKEALDKSAWTVLNKAKPKVEPPKPEEAKTTADQQAAPNGEHQKTNETNNQKKGEEIDVD
jgi:molecular chaperone DnaK (HSP70)